ncbi:MAG: hypothetical protein INR64_09515, partial [Caulobacteraceae bacterium]|nr:hypothetical protein [Caulobacter sp.]
MKRSLPIGGCREATATNGWKQSVFTLRPERVAPRARFDRELFPGRAESIEQAPGTPPSRIFARLCGIAATVLTATVLTTAAQLAVTREAAAAPPSQDGQASHPQKPPQRAEGEAPPPARELTPAEIGALQTMMTNRAITSTLTPANAEALRRMMMETQGMTPPAGTADVIKPHPRRIDIDPQMLLEQPESLKLALGVVTPITFLDSSGRPWPVESVAFDPRMLAQDGNGCGSSPPGQAIQGAGERPSTITMMPCRINTFGNVSIKLEGYALPVILMARSTGASGEVDLPV